MVALGPPLIGGYGDIRLTGPFQIVLVPCARNPAEGRSGVYGLETCTIVIFLRKIDFSRLDPPTSARMVMKGTDHQNTDSVVFEPKVLWNFATIRSQESPRHVDSSILDPYGFVGYMQSV